MKPDSSPSWLKFIRWDLRAVLAVVLGLGLVITFTLAAPDASAVATFDFGTANSGDIESGAIGVMGGGSVYPKTIGGLSYGWDSGSIQAVSHGSAVADKINRDYNFSPGGGSANFKVSGLDAGNYRVAFFVGDSVNKVATQIRTQGRSATITKTAAYGSVDLPIAIASAVDVVSFEFSSAASDASWVINGVRIFTATSAPPDPSFGMTVSPVSQTVRPGGTAVYTVGITPLNGYGSDVNLSVSGLVAGITAQLIPPQITDLPGSAELRLSTSESVSALPYEFVVRAKGTDTFATTKNVIVKLVVSQSAPISSGDSGGGSVEPNQPISQVPGETQTAAEQKAQFKLIDSYVAAEARRLVGRGNINELEGITDEFSAFPIAPALPPAQGVVERSLQYLTQTDIIGTVVDNAPRGKQDTGPKSFWRRMLDGLAKPLGG